MFPSDRTVALLGDFHAKYPTVPVCLLVQTLGDVERMVRSGAACIGIGGVLHMDMTGLQRVEIGGIRLIPVVPLLIQMVIAY
jgi:hypothetical protein